MYTYSPQNFAQKLTEAGWQDRQTSYSAALHHAATQSLNQHPAISVIVIAHAPNQYSLEAFMMLKAQIDSNAELIFVDNGSDTKWAKLMSASATTFVRLNCNTGAYMARNLGSIFARGNILLFVDDDAVPAPGLVQAHKTMFTLYEPLCVRGKAEPLTESIANALARHYDLGDKVIPRYPDLEGNLSLNSQAFFQVGGWDDNLKFGHGGLDLSYRLLHLDPDRGRQLYTPHAIIRHDYAPSMPALRSKREKQSEAWSYLRAKHADFERHIPDWENWQMRGGKPTEVAHNAPEARVEATTATEPEAVHQPKTIYLHIGLPKTGTTAIQSTLECMTEALAAQDYAYVTCGQCFHWLLMLLDAWEKGVNNDEAVAVAIRKHIEALPQSKIILSCENFSGYLFYEKELLSKRIAHVLNSALRGYNIHVLIYLRKQDRFLESIYTQTLHIGRNWKFEEYYEKISRKLLSWKTILDSYSEVFGKKTLTVRIYEKSALYKGDSVADFFQWAQLSEETLKYRQSLQRNESFSPAAVRTIRRHNEIIALRPEEREAYLQDLEKQYSEKTIGASEHLHARQACRHGIHAVRYHLRGQERLQRLLRRSGNTARHDGDTGYLTPAQRTALMADFAEENAAIALEYMGKDDGHLFHDAVPQTVVHTGEASPADLADVLLPVLLHVDERLERMEMWASPNNSLKEHIGNIKNQKSELETRVDILANMIEWLVSHSRNHSEELASQSETLVDAIELLQQLGDVIAKMQSSGEQKK